MTIRSAAFLCMALLLCSCAHDDTAAVNANSSAGYQSVSVNTPGVEGSDCVMQSGNETYSVVAPGSVTVRRAPDVMTVSCFKGDHMRGQQSVTPTFAPREAQQMRKTNSDCLTCNYPSTVTVAMTLDAGAMQVPVRIGP